jgi:AbrB family looped-hinge helix DNA binding protein
MGAQVSGLITNIDANGRVQLPLAIRYGLDLCTGDRIAIDHLGDGTIILKKIEDKVILEGTDGSNAMMNTASSS